MPVFVTHADTRVGTSLVRALASEGADVRAFASGDGDVAAVRTAGAVVAVGDHDDEGHLDAAMTHAHTVVVPTRSWFDDPARVRLETSVIVTAAVQAGVVRIVLVSLLGADPAHSDDVLAACGLGEAAAAAAPIQSVVVRTDGPADELGDIAAALPCDAVLAPVARDRLVAGLAALDAARTTQRGGHAVFTALGPEVTTSELREDDLVGRRWIAPAVRDRLAATLCSRGAPAVEGADLWRLAG